MTKKIGCIGEAMVELSLGTENSNDNDISLGFAGDTLNTAIYLKRLFGNSAEVSYCTVLGSDPLSARMVKFIESESIDTNTISRSEQRGVGIYSISTDDKGERTFNYWRDNSAARTLFSNGDFDALNNFDVVYFSAITLAILPDGVRLKLLEKLATLRAEKNTIVVFDSNYRPALWESQTAAKAIIDKAWSITDIALPSVDDEFAIFEEPNEAAIATRFNNYGVSTGALKRGAAGPLPLGSNTQDHANINYPSIEKVVDSTAAGDSFNAGFLYTWLSENDHSAALLTGHNCAATVIGYAGAIVPLESWNATSSSRSDP